MTVTSLVAGVGLHPFGRFDCSFQEMAADAAREALNDAGVSFNDVDVTLVGNVNEGMAKAQRIGHLLGSPGTPMLSVESACASGAAVLAAGWQYLRAGDASVVLCIGVEKASRGFIAGAGYETWQIESGLGVNPVYFALQAQEMMQAGAITPTDLAAVSVKNHGNGAMNPNAMYQTPVTVEDVLDSRMVCPPLTLLMLCAPNEGAAAMVLMTDEAAHRHGVERPVEMRAVSLVSRMPGDWFVPAACRLAGESSSPTARAAQSALRASRLSIDDVDVIECQDTDAASELIAYRDLGLCAAGEEAVLLRSGDTALGGRIPVNTSGGLLSKGEPLGASHLGQVHEVVTQLRGDGGKRQVPTARVGLCHVMGAGYVAGVSVFAA